MPSTCPTRRVTMNLPAQLLDRLVRPGHTMTGEVIDAIERELERRASFQSYDGVCSVKVIRHDCSNGMDVVKK